MLKVPSIQWLGIKSADTQHHIDRTTDHDSQGLLQLSLRDRKKAIKMLENNVVLAENGSEREWRREIQVMLMLGMKAEMEILAQRSEGLEGWVERKLEEEMQGKFGQPKCLSMLQRSRVRTHG